MQYRHSLFYMAIAAAIVATAIDVALRRPLVSPLSVLELAHISGGTSTPPPPPKTCYVSGDGGYCDGWDDVWCGNATILNPLPDCDMTTDPPQCPEENINISADWLDNVRPFDPLQDSEGQVSTKSDPAACGTCSMCECLDDPANPMNMYCTRDDNNSWDCGIYWNVNPDGATCGIGSGIPD